MYLGYGVARYAEVTSMHSRWHVRDFVGASKHVGGRLWKFGCVQKRQEFDFFAVQSTRQCLVAAVGDGDAGIGKGEDFTCCRTRSKTAKHQLK